MFSLDSVNRGLEPYGLKLEPASGRGLEATVKGGARELKFNPLILLQRQWTDNASHDQLIQRAVESIVLAVNSPGTPAPAKKK